MVAIVYDGRHLQFMVIKVITSTNNQQIKNIQLLNEKAKFRKETGLFVAEGIKIFLEAPSELISRVYVTESYLNKSEYKDKIAALPHEIVKDDVFKKISDTKTPQGILTIIKFPKYSLDNLINRERGVYLVLNCIQDPGNIGTMIRTGEGAGIAGIIMDKGCVDIFNPKVIRSTMGSIFRVPYYISDNLEDTIDKMKKSGIKMLAAHLKGTNDYRKIEYPDRVGIMIGNEGNGLANNIAELSDLYVKIPMEGKLESLNAAVSAALLMYEATR